MSIAHLQTTRPRAPRTEAQIAAAVVAQLLDQGVIGRDPAQLRAAAEKAGVTVADVRAEWYTIQQFGYSVPADRFVTVPAPAPTPTAVSPMRRSPPKPRVRTNSTERKRCARCQVVKSIDEFAPRTDQNGRKAWCDDCRKEYQRERYLTIKEREKVNVVLGFVVQEGDGCIGGTCPRCQQAFVVGQEVETDEAVIHHVGCR